MCDIGAGDVLYALSRGFIFSIAQFDFAFYNLILHIAEMGKFDCSIARDVGP